MKGRTGSLPTPTVDIVMPAAAIFRARPSKSPGPPMPSVETMMCFTSANDSRRARYAFSSGGYMFVSPSAWMVSILAMIFALSVTGPSGQIQRLVVLEDQHAHLVARSQHADRAAEGLFRQVDVPLLRALGNRIVHRAGDVQHQDHRQRRLGFRRMRFGDHRQHFVQRRMAITADGERVVAADGDQPAARRGRSFAARPSVPWKWRRPARWKG